MKHTSQVYNAGDTQESEGIRKNRAITSNQTDHNRSYCVYYPLGINSICPDCPQLLGPSMTSIEKHLNSHGILTLEFGCGVCRKQWPSWRSVSMHFNKSSCRLTSTTIPTNTACTQVSLNVSHSQGKSVEKRSGQGSSSPTANDEESEAEDKRKSAESTNARRRKGSPSVNAKAEAKKDDRSVADARTPAHIGDTSDDDRDQPAENSSTATGNNDVDLKKTEIGGMHYCKFCAANGWETKAGLSQHMRHMHKVEYNASIEVPLKKRRWTRDEMIVLAEIELKLQSSSIECNSKTLAERFPSRTSEAIKLRRQLREYQEVLRQVSLKRATQICEESECAETSSDVDNVTAANGSINRKDEDEADSSDRSFGTRRGADSTTCPDIRRYVRENIIRGKVKMCTTMQVALEHYVADVCGSDPVIESLDGIREALSNVQPSQQHRDGKATVGSKPRSAKAMRKAERYAHYQQLFKKDKTKLASEIFDGVDNSASKPPMSVAYEHYKKIWTVETKDIGTLRSKASVGNDVLLAPITREEITMALDHTKSNTAVGPDRLPLKDLKRIARNELWGAYNIWIGSRRVPDPLKINRTVLLPKGKDNLDNIKNWRPITIASVLIRIYNKILARRMQNVFRTNSKQTGFKPVNGVGQNVALLHNLIRHARTNKNNLFVCMLDVSKAFDSVPHESIKRALTRSGCPSEFIHIIENQYENSYTALSYTDGDSPLIPLKRGVKQGDPMSSILFNLVIDELFEIIGDRFAYELEGVGKVNARAFADDIALMSGSEIGMQQLLSETEEFLQARGLELNAEKCISICLRKAGKAKKSQIADSSVKNPPVFMVRNKPLQLLAIDTLCRYLGVQFTPLGAVDPRVPVSALKSALESLKKAPLKPQQKVVMLRAYLIPRFIFAFTHTECYPKLMGQQDRLVRRWLKEILRLPASVCSEFFYLPLKEGGLGIGKFYDIVGIAKVRLHGTFHRAGDECLRFLVDTQGSAMHSRWCNAMKLSSRPSAVDITIRNVLSLDQSRARLSETVHGIGSKVFRVSPITNQWLCGQTRIMKGNTYIRAIKMRTNTTPTRVSTSRGRDSIKTCRRCGLADETLSHILQTCPVTQGMRCKRHNNVCRKVAEKLRSKGFQVFSEQGMPSPGLRTNISRPDLIAVRGESALVLDVTCVFESELGCLQRAYHQKVDRYKPLAETVKQKYTVREVAFHGLCIGSRGAYDPGHLAIWHTIGFTGVELGMLAVGVIEDSLRTIAMFNNANRLGI